MRLEMQAFPIGEMDHVRPFADGASQAISGLYSRRVGRRCGWIASQRSYAEPGRVAGKATVHTPRASASPGPDQDITGDLIAQKPAITLFECRDALGEAEGVELHPSAIASLLSRPGIT